MNCHVYELSCLWIVISMNCHVYELSCLWIVISLICHVSELSCLWIFMSMNFHVYELSHLWIVMSMNYHAYEMSCLWFSHFYEFLMSMNCHPYRLFLNCFLCLWIFCFWMFFSELFCWACGLSAIYVSMNCPSIHCCVMSLNYHVYALLCLWIVTSENWRLNCFSYCLWSLSIVVNELLCLRFLKSMIVNISPKVLM
jgi:hypothetical protein